MTYACFWLRRILWTVVGGVLFLLGGAGLFLRGTGPVVILLHDRQFSLPLGPLVLSLLGMFLFLIALGWSLAWVSGLKGFWGGHRTLDLLLKAVSAHFRQDQTALLQVVKKLPPSSRPVWGLLIRLWQGVTDKQDVDPLLGEALTVPALAPIVTHLKVRQLLQEGQGVEAQCFLKAAQQKDPHNKWALETLATLALERQDFSEMASLLPRLRRQGLVSVSKRLDAALAFQAASQELDTASRRYRLLEKAVLDDPTAPLFKTALLRAAAQYKGKEAAFEWTQRFWRMGEEVSWIPGFFMVFAEEPPGTFLERIQMLVQGSTQEGNQGSTQGSKSGAPCDLGLLLLGYGAARAKFASSFHQAEERLSHTRPLWAAFLRLTWLEQTEPTTPLYGTLKEWLGMADPTLHHFCPSDGRRF
jgi:hypothetical protein